MNLGLGCCVWDSSAQALSFGIFRLGRQVTWAWEAGEPVKGSWGSRHGQLACRVFKKSGKTAFYVNPVREIPIYKIYIYIYDTYHIYIYIYVYIHGVYIYII